MARWGSAPGFSVQWLDAAEVLKIEPRVNSSVLGAILLESPAALDSRSFTLALLEGARAHGAVLVQDEVTGVDDSRVTLRDGEIGCDAVVLAAGPWAGEASGWLGFDLPIGPLKGQIVHVAQMDPPLPRLLTGAGPDRFQEGRARVGLRHRGARGLRQPDDPAGSRRPHREGRQDGPVAGRSARRRANIVPSSPSPPTGLRS